MFTHSGTNFAELKQSIEDRIDNIKDILDENVRAESYTKVDLVDVSYYVGKELNDILYMIRTFDLNVKSEKEI